jgi:hypothetical protein
VNLLIEIKEIRIKTIPSDMKKPRAVYLSQGMFTFTVVSSLYGTYMAPPGKCP